MASVALVSDRSNLSLSAGAREKLISWLPEKGNPPAGHITNFKLPGVCGGWNFPETENHILMMQITRYFHNQLTGINNAENGFDQWMVDHLNHFLQKYFDEYNSKPYQAHALAPIYTLAALAESPSVRAAANNVIDMTSAVQAAQSNKLRRFSPFRRQPLSSFSRHFLVSPTTWTFRSGRANTRQAKHVRGWFAACFP